MTFPEWSLVRTLLRSGPLLVAGAIGIISLAYAQTSVVPIVQPHVHFVDATGAPCSGCTLQTFRAGTTTPLATYVDSTGIGQNTNPITLDASGSASSPPGNGQIWLGRNSYKFVLKDPSGTTLWSADNVTAANLLPCGPANTIQIANTALNGLNCDSAITINTTAHTLNVGTLTPAHVTIGALGTPTSWTFDTTSPATALASLGTVGTVSDGAGTTTPNLIGLSTSTAHAITYSATLPNGTLATTQAADDNSTKVASTAYVKAPGAITPTSVAVAGGTAMTNNQGNGTLIQHSTGSVVSGNCGKFDANGNIIDAGALCGGPTVARTCGANGCYRVEADGTVTAWGIVSMTFPSASVVTGPVTFPNTGGSAFAATPTVVVSLGTSPDGASPPNSVTTYVQTLTTSGFTGVIRCPVNIGGSGCPASMTSTVDFHWYAIGHN